ncbi:MAG TPA: response regulator transcription factor [Chromatiaceae bacterium]|nr:response regulator transcription factor [Chromatiaceae bacterium]
MKILIADDEQPARAQLRRLLEQIDPEHEIAGEAADGAGLLKHYREHGADVVLLDIRMPGMDGIETARRLNQENPRPAVIFCTAYDEHALQAFDANAIAYLLKPIRKERLAKALANATALTRAQLNSLQTGDEEQWISASWLGGVKRVRLADVIYFKAESKYVIACHRDGELVLEDTLKELESRYPGRILRIHRNALINVDCLRGVSKLASGQCAVLLDGVDERLEVSRRQLAVVKRTLRENT